MKKLLYIFILLFSAYAFAADNLQDGIPITGGFTPGSDGEYGLDVSINSSVSGAPELGAGLRPGSGGVWYYYDTGTSTWTQIGTGSMTYPGAGIPLSTGTAWGTSYTLDTDLSAVSATDNTLPSAKATKAYIDAQIAAAVMDTGLPLLSITTPATNETWVQSTTYEDLAGTAESSAGLATIEWKLNEGSYAAVTDDGSLGTGSEAWTVSTMVLAEAYLNTISVQAVSDSALTRTQTRTIYADETDPVVVMPADTTHSGSDVSQTISVTSVTETNEASRAYRVMETTSDPDVEVTAWTTFTGLSFTYDLPDEAVDYEIFARCVDLSGRTGTDSQAWTYSSPTACDLDGGTLIYNLDHVDGTTTACVSGGTETVTLFGDGASTAQNHTSGGQYSFDYYGADVRIQISAANKITSSVGYLEFYIYLPAEWSSTTSVALFEFRQNATNYVRGYYQASPSRCVLYHYEDNGGTNNQIVYIYQTPVAGQWNRVQFWWDSTVPVLGGQINENAAKTESDAIGAFATEPTNLVIGELTYGSNPAVQTYIDDIKLRSTLP